MTELHKHQISQAPFVRLESIAPKLKPHPHLSDMFVDEIRKLLVRVGHRQTDSDPKLFDHVPLFFVDIVIQPDADASALTFPQDEAFFRAVWGDGTRSPELARLTGLCSIKGDRYVTQIQGIEMKMPARTSSRGEFPDGGSAKATNFPIDMRAMIDDPFVLLAYASACCFAWPFQTLLPGLERHYQIREAAFTWSKEIAIRHNNDTATWRFADYFETPPFPDRTLEDGAFLFGAEALS